MGGTSGNLDFRALQSAVEVVLAFAREHNRSSARAAGASRPRKRVEPREGKVERTVLTVLEGLNLVSERVARRELVQLTMEALDTSAEGLRDTRKQVATRAVRNLERKGKLRLVDGWVET